MSETESLEPLTLNVITRIGDPEFPWPYYQQCCFSCGWTGEALRGSPWTNAVAKCPRCFPNLPFEEV